MKFKGLLLFIMIITLSLLFSTKSYAAELYGVNVYIFHDLYNNGTLQEEQAQQYSNYYSSSSPITVYLMDRVSAPSSTYVSIGYYVVSDSPIYNVDGVECSETFSDSNGNIKYLEEFSYERAYARPFSADIYMISTGAENAIMLKQYYSLEDFLTNYLSGTLDYDIEIDWENAQYNESIGYLQNVMLKEDGLTHKDFEITWSTSNTNYTFDDWRIQIGYHTRFQKELFGERLLYTNLNYVTWLDALYYINGKWTCNVDDLYSVIPDCKYPAYSGSFYLRLVHVDSSTGNVEYGGWGELTWLINSNGDASGGRFVTSEYNTLVSSNVLDKDGVSNFFDEEKVIDTSSDTSQKYVINTTNGSVDSSSTDVYNSIYDDNGSLDLSKAGDYFISGINSLLSTVKSFPTLLGRVVSFLPSDLVSIMCIGFILIIICRIWGR